MCSASQCSTLRVVPEEVKDKGGKCGQQEEEKKEKEKEKKREKKEEKEEEKEEEDI